MTGISKKKLFAELELKLASIGYQRELYKISPASIGAFRFTLSPELLGYVNFAFYSKYQKVGVALGFGFPELKQIVDECLINVGKVQGIIPKYSILNPCPAVLFPLELFVGQKDGLPIDLNADFTNRVINLIHEKVFNGKFSWIRSRSKLCEFLVDSNPPFTWFSGDMPRRLSQAAYLLSLQHISFEKACTLLEPANSNLQGSADFAIYQGSLVFDVLEFYYSTPAI